MRFPEPCVHKPEMHKLSSQFITLHCSSFILKRNTYAQNDIPFKMFHLNVHLKFST